MKRTNLENLLTLANNHDEPKFRQFLSWVYDAAEKVLNSQTDIKNGKHSFDLEVNAAIKATEENRFHVKLPSSSYLSTFGVYNAARKHLNSLLESIPDDSIRKEIETTLGITTIKRGLE